MVRKPTSLIVNELIDVFKLEEVDTIPDILEVYGLLGYLLGLSIEGLTTKEEISYDTLKSLYLEEDSVGAALMLQGQMVRSWVEPWKIKQQGNKKVNRKDNKND